ncbi:hypothetical protein HU200_058054 [Digitaria exilis]|uniref:Reverse transcriptase zinc-binding domain-containing protein n=1 Tax=Digitaria exilis TaxID=1010633 RepID=A0A835AA83_9POAL|nr:hypothetical protein HU200_058054 [Digitaria exilis]
MSREDERNLEGLLGVVGGGGTVLVRVGVAVEVRIVVRSAERRVVGGVTGGYTTRCGSDGSNGPSPTQANHSSGVLRAAPVESTPRLGKVGPTGRLKHTASPFEARPSNPFSVSEGRRYRPTPAPAAAQQIGPSMEGGMGSSSAFPIVIPDDDEAGGAEEEEGQPAAAEEEDAGGEGEGKRPGWLPDGFQAEGYYEDDGTFQATARARRGHVSYRLCVHGGCALSRGRPRRPVENSTASPSPRVAAASKACSARLPPPACSIQARPARSIPGTWMAAGSDLAGLSLAARLRVSVTQSMRARRRPCQHAHLPDLPSLHFALSLVRYGPLQQATSCCLRHVSFTCPLTGFRFGLKSEVLHYCSSGAMDRAQAGKNTLDDNTTLQGKYGWLWRGWALEIRAGGENFSKMYTLPECVDEDCDTSYVDKAELPECVDEDCDTSTEDNVPSGSSWAAWVHLHVCIANMTGEISGHHWTTLKELLPLYRAITSVTVGDALPGVANPLPGRCIKVRDAVTGGITRHLAHSELTEVAAIIERVVLPQAPDVRASPFEGQHGKLHTSAIYKLLQHDRGDTSTVGAEHNCASPRVKFFSWLMSRGRIQSRSQLHRRGVVSDATCEICGLEEEMATHIMFGCSFAREWWSAINIELPGTPCARFLNAISCPQHIPDEHFDGFLLLCCWKLWKRRNTMIFRQETATLCEVLSQARTEARLWGYR